MKVVIIGAGLIGCERIEAIQHIQKSGHDVSILSVYDPNITALEKVKNKYNVPVSMSLEDALNTRPDWAIVCVPHHVAAETIKIAFKANVNVLAEKPLGRSGKECFEIWKSKPPHLKLYIGFNYRFYEGINMALKDAKAGKFGELISVNMILGHGNAPDMTGSWKLDPVKDGGVLVDLGVHLLDLSQQLTNNIGLKIEKCKLWNGFWNTGIVDEEAHMLLSDRNGTIFNLQVSLNRWRSTFRLEINGTEGYGIVEGRGRSYGNQTYRTGERWGWNKYNASQSETEKHFTCDAKKSFIDETMAVLLPQNNIISPCNSDEILGVMDLLDQCYESAK